MNRIKELICYFLENSPHSLNKTEIVKMIYLFEYYHVQTYGAQYSDIKFIRWNYGPYSSVINDELNDLISIGLINREIIDLNEGREVYLHNLANIDIEDSFLLDDNVRYIADRVIFELSCRPYDEMINIVYSTPPMVKILREEERIGSKLLGEELDMKESGGELYKTTKERLIAARKRRLEREPRGTDEEYIKCITEEYEILEPLRREATIYGIDKF